MSIAIDMRKLKEDFMRANTYAKRQDTAKALEQFIQTLESYSQVKNDSKAQETEYLINDIFVNLTANREIIEIFNELGTDVPRLKIQKNNFINTLTVLNALQTKLVKREIQKQEQIEKEKQDKLEACLIAGIEAAQNNEISLARVNYKRYVNESSDKKQALMQVVESLKANEFQDLAIEFCEIAMRLFPKELYFCYNAIEAAINYQDFEAINGYYIFLFQAIGKTPETLMHKAYTLAAINKLQEADIIAKEVLSLEADNQEAHDFLKNQ